MSYAFSPPPVPALPIRGGDDLFPVRRIYCVGRNYAEHAIEMGHDPDKESPFFFQKNPDNLVTDGRFPYPSATKDVHHEIELVVALSKGGEDIPVERALDHVFGYAVGLDMTRRDLQGTAKKLGRPWEIGKAFERSAPMGPLRAAAEIGHPAAGAIVLTVNGALRQEGDL
ncbi:MAG: fumarylacetoacetate hydrolase family protein, partial [Rhizobiales bacterium]|nr:fumarylacetoacetate hydrolase family protein [Hyphomicrobiales bacterium]